MAGLISGDPNGARDFDGVDDQVDLNPATFGTPATLSVEAWVRVDTTKPSGQFHFVATDALSDLGADGFSFAINSANRPLLFVGRSTSQRATATSSTTLTAGTTYHLVGTHDGARVRVYVNGVERASVAYTGGIAWAATRDLWLGRQHKSSGRAQRFLDGRLDEVALYRSALSAQR